MDQNILKTVIEWYWIQYYTFETSSFGWRTVLSCHLFRIYGPPLGQQASFWKISSNTRLQDRLFPSYFYRTGRTSPIIYVLSLNSTERRRYIFSLLYKPICGLNNMFYIGRTHLHPFRNYLKLLHWKIMQQRRTISSSLKFSKINNSILLEIF